VLSNKGAQRLKEDLFVVSLFGMRRHLQLPRSKLHFVGVDMFVL
jgi:hypothetical protein